MFQGSILGRQASCCDTVTRSAKGRNDKYFRLYKNDRQLLFSSKVYDAAYLSV